MKKRYRWRANESESCFRVLISQRDSSVDSKSALGNVPETIGLTSQPTRKEVRTFPWHPCRNSCSQSRGCVFSLVQCTVCTVYISSSTINCTDLDIYTNECTCNRLMMLTRTPSDWPMCKKRPVHVMCPRELQKNIMFVQFDCVGVDFIQFFHLNSFPLFFSFDFIKQ